MDEQVRNMLEQMDSLMAQIQSYMSDEQAGDSLLDSEAEKATRTAQRPQGMDEQRRQAAAILEQLGEDPSAASRMTEDELQRLVDQIERGVDIANAETGGGGESEGADVISAIRAKISQGKPLSADERELLSAMLDGAQGGEVGKSLGRDVADAIREDANMRRNEEKDVLRHALTRGLRKARQPVQDGSDRQRTLDHIAKSLGVELHDPRRTDKNRLNPDSREGSNGTNYEEARKSLGDVMGHIFGGNR